MLEYGLGAYSEANIHPKSGIGLNPYCAGIWSRRRISFVIELSEDSVLILIVLEYGLGECYSEQIVYCRKS